MNFHPKPEQQLPDDDTQPVARSKAIVELNNAKAEMSVKIRKIWNQLESAEPSSHPGLQLQIAALEIEALKIEKLRRKAYALPKKPRSARDTENRKTVSPVIGKKADSFSVLEKNPIQKVVVDIKPPIRPVIQETVAVSEPVAAPAPKPQFVPVTAPPVPRPQFASSFAELMAKEPPDVSKTITGWRDVNAGDPHMTDAMKHMVAFLTTMGIARLGDAPSFVRRHMEAYFDLTDLRPQKVAGISRLMQSLFTAISAMPSPPSTAPEPAPGG